ncbi:MAG TPA: hypothetical protein VGW10_13990, partial [Solirubrobacteraceae bacterium]|nr:hypothetical protein [Solirubrobacteraceae bacterium]
MLRNGISCLVALLAAMAVASATASAASESYANFTPIKMDAKGKASPYPSSVSVQGRTGRVTDVAVTLRGFEHERPADVDVLLVAPSGEKAIVFADACGATPHESVNLTIFERAGAGDIPDTGPCDQGVYAPANHPGLDSWPNTSDFDTVADLDRFERELPNGQWSLYVIDDRTDKVGRIGSGWSLTLVTEPVDTLVPGVRGDIADRYPLTQTVTQGGVVTDVDVSLN